MTTKNIILRAEQYANKENADFYSYAEKVAMLNESWITLYQYLCNTGDRYWLKSVTFSKKEFQLPEDCYQISAVYMRVGSKKRQIYGYELKANKIYINETGIYNNDFILEYYPTPKVLHFKDVIKKCPFQTEGLRCIHNGKALYAEASDVNYKIYDSVVKESKETSLPLSDWVNIYDDGNILTVSNDTYSIYKFSDGNIYTIGDTVVIYNNCVFYKNSTGALQDANGNTVKESIDLEKGLYTTEDFVTFTPVSAIPMDNTYIESVTNTGVTNGQKVYTTYGIVGYYDKAFLTRDASTGVYYIESLYNDTDLNYPNNIFFTFIALDIALKMRSKQGIDNTQLNSQWLSARDALFNSIEKNKGNHVTIKDVYNEYEAGGIYY